MIKLLIISSQFPPTRSPEASHTHFIARQLAKAGLDVGVLTSTAGDPPAGDGFAVRAVVPNWGWRAMRTIRREIRRFEPDVVLLIYLGWIYHFHPMVTFLPRLMGRRPRFVTLFENVQVNDRPWTGRLAKLRRVPGLGRIDPQFGRLLTGSDRVIVLARAHLVPLVAAYPPVADKAVVIPAPPLMEVLPDPAGDVRRTGRRTLGVAEDELLVAYFGYIYRGKGLETLLRAVGRLPPGVKVKVVAIGEFTEPDYETEVRRATADAGVEEFVHFAGHCDPAEVSMFLLAADVCCLPFDVGVRVNNSSVAVAATHGLAIVTTAGPDIELEFKDRENVWLCPPKDPTAIAEALSTLAHDAALRRRLADGALAMADEHFSWNAVIPAMRRALDPK